MTASPRVAPAATHPALEHGVPLADLVDHAAVALAGCSLTRVTDAAVLDRDDAGTWLSSLCGRRIVHRCSVREHLFVDVDTRRAVRIVIDRSDAHTPVMFMAQSPGPARGLYQQLVEAACGAPVAGHRHTPMAGPHPHPSARADERDP
ncbi:hypothetical protein [Amycolatopsis orientalis]|uniref:hypothetical protein n=1 Tax=Amycolatopsis orientalis TaxID=31958 RepID=UPI0012696662|nr:hypothetical protein [Amycolatopsis orientalis]